LAIANIKNFPLFTFNFQNPLTPLTPLHQGGNPHNSLPKNTPPASVTRFTRTVALLPVRGGKMLLPLMGESERG